MSGARDEEPLYVGVEVEVSLVVLGMLESHKTLPAFVVQATHPEFQVA